MMDPLTAAGLAGNIVTFVDFSTRAVSRAKQLYESASGATAENEELQSLAENVKSLADKTRCRPSTIPQSGHSSLNTTSEKVLDNLSQQCVQVADELLETLDSVKVKGTDGRGFKSTVHAMKSVWKQDRIDALQQRLDRISRQLLDCMNMGHLEEITRKLRDLALENTRLEANRSREIEQLRRDFHSAIDEIKSHANDEEEECIPRAWLVLSDTARRGKAYFAEQVILQSLRFAAIDSRSQSVAEEHPQTFQWIFEPASSTKFVEWLTKEDGVYWISGKPGSGKSTLMKFVAEHDQTQKYLKEWAGDKRLVAANFFFWSAAAQKSQKSQRGLLRTILYQILCQCPELIQSAYHDQWVAMTSHGKVMKESRGELLTVPALLETLRKISTTSASDTKFCFFLDGLDEYDGRPADIIKLVDILKSFQNVKICVSSRPWNEFEDRFGNSSPWKLYLHELTRKDIHRYVQDTLGEDTRFQKLQKEDPQCPDFIQSIVVAADGVFLWVFLVVRSLVDGLTNSDRVKDLQNRLNETPKDLKDYFETILFSTENRYRSQTARVFSVAIHANGTLPLMAYWVIDQEDPKYVFKCSTETPAYDVLHSRVQTMRRRLKVLSKGLLEAEFVESPSMDSALFKMPVEFLHRTVKDYLQTPEAKTMLQSWSSVVFNVDWEILNALGTLAKMAPRASFLPCTALWRRASDFMGHARRLDPYDSTRLTSILEHLQTALAPAIEENIDALNEWCGRQDSDSLFGGIELLPPNLLIISACVCVGTLNYITQKFERESQLCLRIPNHIPSLYWCVKEILIADIRSVTDWSVPSSMLELSLEHGVDPNNILKGKSEWQKILEDFMAWQVGGDVVWAKSFEAIKLLLRYGADFEQGFTVWLRDGTEGEMKAQELLREMFDADQFSVLKDIVSQRAGKPKETQKTSKRKRQFKPWFKSKK